LLAEMLEEELRLDFDAMSDGKLNGLDIIVRKGRRKG